MNMLYIRAIELAIKDAFPDKEVVVWYEDSPFSIFGGVVKARVGDAWAYTHVDERSTEANVIDILIAMFKEKIHE